MPIKNLKDQKFGRLTVLELSHNDKWYNCYWKCRCECDNTVVVRGSNLISGHSKSCGCLKNELSAYRQFKHGDHKSKLYFVWHAIIQRCKNSNNSKYKNYGNRGIDICSDWLKYLSFKDWAIKNGYIEGLEIDRKDNDKGYYPENCRWVTHQHNLFNTRGHKNSSSEYKGVCYNKQKSKWMAIITKNNKRYYLGYFNNEKDAAIAYNKRAKELFGEYAYLNQV